MTPPTALSPYSTAPLLPRVISMRSIELRGMVEKSTPAMSMSLSLRPLISTRVLEVANAPNPRRSTLVFAPLTPPNRLVSCTPGTCAMISCKVCAGECAISSAVMTVAEAPTMPANCRTGAPPPPWPPPCDATLEPVPGAGFGLLDGLGFGATTRRVPEPSSVAGLARVRFWSPGGLTSIAGNCSARGGLLGLRAGNAERHDRREKTGRQQEMAAPLGGWDGGRHGSGLGMTSVARHSEPSPTIVLQAALVKLMPVLPDRHLRV